MIDDRVPRSSWPLGRITRVRKSSTDEHVRSVTVKTSTSLYDHPDRPYDRPIRLFFWSEWRRQRARSITELNCDSDFVFFQRTVRYNVLFASSFL